MTGAPVFGLDRYNLITAGDETPSFPNFKNRHFYIFCQGPDGTGLIFVTGIGQGFVLIGDKDVDKRINDVLQQLVGFFNHIKTGEIQRNPCAGAFGCFKNL